MKLCAQDSAYFVLDGERQLMRLQSSGFDMWSWYVATEDGFDALQEEDCQLMEIQFQAMMEAYHAATPV